MSWASDFIKLFESNKFTVTVFNRWEEPQLYKVKTTGKKKEAASFIKSYPNAVATIDKERSKKLKHTLGFPAYHGGKEKTDTGSEYYIKTKKVSYEEWSNYIEKMDKKHGV